MTSNQPHTPGSNQDADMQAIINAQIEDIYEMTAKNKGKQREGQVDDAQMALEMQLGTLLDFNSSLEDRRMAQSVATAIEQDMPLVQAEYGSELQFAMVQSSEASSKEMPDASSKSKSEESSDLLPVQSSGKLTQCISCGDGQLASDIKRMPCSHEYCRTCIEQLFQHSMKDETLFPPRCDGKEIPLSLVKDFLSSETEMEFAARFEELSTKDRIYCAQQSCLSFIPNGAISNDIATCPLCLNKTCAICKGPQHNEDCPKDTALQSLLETASKEGWQRCYQCHRVVELSTGCYHITCKCGAQFCYLCGEVWKTCECPQWDEARLMDRAQVFVHRYHRNVAEAVHHLQVMHDCPHNQGYTIVNGEHVCENCYDVLGQYIYNCNACQINHCGRCIRNRR